MSHRDKDCRTKSVTNAQELSTAIQKLLSAVEWKGIRLRKDCGWAVSGLVTAALIWGCSSKNTVTGRFGQTLKFSRWLGRCLAPAKTSYQAFMKLLVRWTADLRKELMHAYRVTMEREFPDQFRIGGYVLVGGDGTKLQLARTQSNEAHYSPTKTRAKGKKARKVKRRKLSREVLAQRARDKKADSPQMMLTLLYHLTLRFPWEWRLGRSDTSERQHLLDMVPQLPLDALMVADCGFVGYEFWSKLLDSGRQFVIRVGGNVHLLKKLGVAREANGTVYLWSDKAAKRKQKPPLVLRLVEVHDGRQSWYLVTSVLNPKRLSDRQVAQIYTYRWQIELFFRDFKQTFGRAKLRSHKCEHAECEAEWSLLGSWTMLLHARLLLKQKDDQGQLSMARVVRAFAQSLVYYKWRPEPGESLHEMLSQAVVDSYRRRDKTSRDYPRKCFRHPIAAPAIVEATKIQRQQVQRLMKQAA